MNPWEALLIITGWVFLFLGALAAVIVVYAALIGIWRGVIKWSPSGKAKEQAKADALELYMAEATRVSTIAYKDEIIMPGELVKAFRLGARWGWGFSQRK